LQGRQVEARYSVRPAVFGDRYLLCSDGVSEPLSPDELATTLRAYPDPQLCADQLVALALQHGATDNVSCIVADVAEVCGDVGADAGAHPIVDGAAAVPEPATP
jgi:protein phosphatase